jgi:geranylgeranyl diphosphate synthase type I
MVRYHVGFADEHFSEIPASTGKLVRPLLCLLACEAAGGAAETALSAAVAVELIHDFSLVHDDIEDNSRTRHHRPTVWSLWGIPQAINAGDTLFSLGRLTLSRLADKGVPPLRVARAHMCLDSACLALCEGQYLDLAFESESRVGLDDYLWMVRGKTGALMACACELGALAATDDTEKAAALHRFGYNLGMAFQVEDDRIGVWGDASRTGKPVGDDLRQHKKVLPVVWLWEALSTGDHTRSQEDAGAAIDSVFGAETPSDTQIGEAVRLLEKAGALDYCVDLAREYTKLAIESLNQSGLDGPGSELLIELARQLTGRNV